MKPKTTIVLIVLLVLVGLGIWLSKVIRRGSGEQDNSTAGKVFPNATGEAKKLTIENSNGTKFVFVHTNGRWNMIEPRLLLARADAVGSIVRMMKDLTYRRILSMKNSSGAPSDTAMGLDRPRWTVVLIDAADQTCILHVGSVAPTVGGEDETYVRVSEQGPVYVVPQNLQPLLQRDVKDYRDMSAWPEVKRDDIVAVEIQGRQNYTLRKIPAGWEITKPFTARADAAAVRNLLTKLTSNLKANRILTEAAVSPASYGLDRPQLVVTVTTQELLSSPAATQPMTTEKTYTLLLGNHRGKNICAMVKSKPEVFTLPEEMLDTLQPSLDSLRDKMLLAFSPADVDRVQLDRDGTTLVLQRNGGWSMTEPFAGPTQPGTTEELLQTLMVLRAEKWIAPQADESMRLPSPRATITLHMQNGGTQMLRIGGNSGDGKSVFCQPGEASAVAIVNRQDVEKVLQPARNYWSRMLLPISPDAEIQGMTIERSDGVYVLTKYDDAWNLVAPVTCRADAKTLETICEMLPGLQARNIVTLGETLPKAYTIANDRITVSLTTRGPEGESPVTWRLALVKIGNNVFAWREGRPIVAVGLCPVSLYTTFNQPLEKMNR